MKIIQENPTDLENHALTPDQARELFKVAQNIKSHPRYNDCPKGQDAALQPYFPDGPLYIAKDIEVSAPKGSVFHQYSAIRGSTYTLEPDVNGVGVWGAATSVHDGGKAWGGFFTAEGPNDANLDSQLVGVEVDVINKAKAGVSPNQSKVGIQIVSIGERDSSAALEIISDNRSKWQNGILFDNNSISTDGAAIALSQRSPIRTGIDFSNGHFNDSAIRIGNNQIIRLDDSQQDTTPATIRNNSDNKLQITAGRSGISIRDNKNEKTLVEIDPSGHMIFEGATPVLKSPSGNYYALSVSDDGKLSTTPYVQQ